ncbi:LANO_0D01178g1_1 [Lachancea nothofagi CBS 11611]|uniref:LANO_0D01178g1_1 n=1 Tax=Lachancea nothofagi CBS 11611 TaxID=1266666 RepID=A0A1G4JDG4_9SACH|nr:LANO_0D01178g1_1 [Lachancea nothofagi CBS 11611]
MSFWPFGQNENSNINRFLEEYFQVLHALEKRDEIRADSRLTGDVAAQDEIAATDTDDTIGNPHHSEDETSIAGSYGSATHTTSRTLSLTQLSSAYIDNILSESELLNELTRQNNTLLDFLCFGYFFTPDHVKVQNIEYLIDQLMACVEHIQDGRGGSSRMSNSSSRGNDSDSDSDDDDEDNEDNDVDDEDTISTVKPRASPLNKATIISEIFALDIWLISESLVKNTGYLNKIWSIMYRPNFASEKSALVPIFLKINQNLLATRQDQYLNFIRTKATLVDDLLQHIEISVLMDFLLKIISTDKQESPSGIIELVREQQLLNRLLSYLDNEKYEPDIQACAGDLLKAIITISANAPLDDMSIGPNSLTRQLASEECMSFLLETIINKRGNALINAVSIVIELIRKNNSDYDQVNLLSTTLEANPPSMRDPIYLGTMLRLFTQKLPSIFQILTDVETDSTIKLLENQMGEKFKPLEFERFKVVELIAELLHCSNMGLLNSKKAERIVNDRNKARGTMTMQLQDALVDLELHDNVTNTDPVMDSDPAYIEDVDESFDIPYVNSKQNTKLRDNPTVGDLFKIKVYDHQILPKIVHLFLQYPWNNFWHNVVFDIVQQIFNGRMDFSYNSFLVYSLFNNKSASEYMEDASKSFARDFQITRDLVLEGYRKSYAFYEKHYTALGFMGHLVLIAEEIVKFSKVYKVELISPDIQAALQAEDWVFYSEDVLNDTRIMYSKILGGNDYLDENNNYDTDGTNGDDDTNSAAESQLGGNLINVTELNQGQNSTLSNFSTQSDLHLKLKKKLIDQAQGEVDRQNEKKGVIILGMAPEAEFDKASEKQ